MRAYFRGRVNVREPATVEAWLLYVLPRILAGNEESARLAAVYGDMIRRIELPGVKDGLKFAKATTIPDQKIRTSLSVVGPVNLVKKLDRIRELDQPPAVARALQADAIEKAADEVAGAALKHVLEGGRETIDQTVRKDEKSLGYIRVTKTDPCYFCAMLASRGITYGPYNGQSFDASDARFIGEGNVKVHDHCSCSLKPVYDPDDPYLDASQAWREMWDSMEHRGGPADVRQFRALYEGRKDTAA